jgi:glutaredoxin 3
MMAKIEIYTTPFCGYCARAKGLLDGKGVAYEEMDVMMDDKKRTEMRERSKSRTVPQIFINGQHIGGSDELAALEKAGKLDALLTQPG